MEAEAGPLVVVPGSQHSLAVPTTPMSLEVPPPRPARASQPKARSQGDESPLQGDGTPDVVSSRWHRNSRVDVPTCTRTKTLQGTIEVFHVYPHIT